MTEPRPVRRTIAAVIKRARLGSPSFRYSIGAVDKPAYAYLVYQAAKLAHNLGHARVSVIEFGVAGGRGLLALEQHAEWVEKVFPVKVEIYGFDTGEGLPEPADYRDLPYQWKPGFFRMDQPALRAKLKRSTLVLGEVRDTAASFVEKFNPAPIGAVAHDFDFYSSTMDGLKLFEVDAAHILPRVFCYFDDVIGDDITLYNDFTGERAAIHDFNATHSDCKLSPIYHLAAGADQASAWKSQMWSLHRFSHPHYCSFVSGENQQLPI